MSLRVDVGQLIELAVVVSPGRSGLAFHCEYPKFRARRNPVLKTDQSFDSERLFHSTKKRLGALSNLDFGVAAVTGPRNVRTVARKRRLSRLVMPCPVSIRVVGRSV